MFNFLLQNRKNILKFSLSFLLIVGIFEYLGSLINGTDFKNHSIHTETSSEMVVTISFNLFGTILAIWLLSSSVRKSFKSRLGLYPPQSKSLLIGFMTGFLVMASGLLILLSGHQIYIRSLQFSFYDLLLSIYIFFVIALTEELLMRGFILIKLLANVDRWPALIFSALIFSALHLFNAHIGAVAILNLFLAGLLLGLPVIYTGNIWYSVALHFSWNFFQSLLGFNVSGKDLYSVIIQYQPSLNIWNGGLFGYEASIYCLISQIIAILFFCKIFRACLNFVQ